MSYRLRCELLGDVAELTEKLKRVETELNHAKSVIHFQQDALRICVKTLRSKQAAVQNALACAESFLRD